MQVRGFSLPIGDFMGKSKGKGQNAKVKSRDRSMRAAFSSGSRNLHGKARKKRCSARLALQPLRSAQGRLCGFSIPPWFGRCGPRKFGLSCWRRGRNPHRWKCRRAGERALRYLPPAMSAEPFAVGGRLAAPWFRIHPAERRVGRALPLRLRIPFTRSNGA